MKSPWIYIFAFAGSLFLHACQDADREEPDTPRRDIALSTKSVAINRETRRFSLEFLRLVAGDGETNFCISPLSASLCMGMILNGADGETYAEILRVLGYEGYTNAEINEYVQIMQDELPRLDGKTELTNANSLWLRESYPVRPEFVEINRTYYHAEVYNEPFDASTLKRINQWCSEHTRGLIPEIIDQIPPAAVTYLVNALYFKGKWSHAFKKENTREAEFYLAGGSAARVPMMQQTVTARYYSDAEVRIVELPYGNEAFSMILFLSAAPEKTSVSDLLATLTPEKWDRWTSGFYPASIQLSLPRFTLEYKKELNETFEAAGVRQAFDPELADFTQISDRRPYLSLLRQKTFIEVDESGTQAAAVTIGGIFDSAVGPDREPIELRFDHPFGFVIREKSTGAFIFAGKIGKPI